MKKLFIIFIAFTFSTITSAQANLRTGISFSDQSLEYQGFDLDPEVVMGYLIGINYQVELTENFSVRQGMQLIKKGSHWRIDQTGVNTRANFHYLEFPLDVVYDLNPFSVYLGTNVGLLFSASAFGRSIMKGSSKDDVGFNAGLEYDFKAFGLGINYNHSFANIFDSHGSVNDVKNRVINAYVTIDL